MKTYFLLLVLLFSMGTYAQSSGTITGTITDMEMNGEPFLFANIELKGTRWSTETNLNGNFEIDDVATGEYILAIAFPGYESLEVPVMVQENNTIKIQKGLRAKSIDIGAILQAENISKKKLPVLVTSSSK